MKKKIILTTLGLIGMVGLIFFAGMFVFKKNNQLAELIKKEENFTIIAEKSDNSGVLKDSNFIIKSNFDYEENELKEKIKVTDDREFSINKTRKGEYYLKLKNQLEENKIFNISISENADEPDLSWAFQTESALLVNSTYPSANSTWARIDSGIEIRFSKKVESIEEYFEISPKVDGRFEYNGKTVIFVPKKLEYDTKYTVTVKAGINSIYGEMLKEDYSFSFSTKTNNEKTSWISAEDNTVSVKGTKFIEINTGTEFKDEKFYVDIYDLENITTYLEVSDKKDEEINVSDYSKVNNFETYLTWEENNGYDRAAYLMLPDNLAYGWYLVSIKTGGGIGRTKNKQIYATIQVTDVAVYIQDSNGQALVWVNDIENNTVSTNAKVQITDIKYGGNLEGYTDDKGIAIFDIANNSDKRFIITTEDEKMFGLRYYIHNKDEEQLDDLYYIYMYTDREIYMPTDTISFWGIITPKKSSEKIPSEITVKMGNEDVKVKVTPSGSFVGEYSFNNRVSGYLNMGVKLDGLEMWIDSKTISEYVKPTYVLTVESNKEYYKKGETIELTSKTTFFDETPAGGVNLNVSFDGQSIECITDTNGIAINEFFVNSNKDSWYPYNIYTTVRTSGGEEDASTNKKVLYFPTSYTFDAKWEDNVITVTGNEIDFSKVRKDSYSYNKIKGAPADLTGNIKIIKKEYFKEEDGEYYDFINKVNVKKYKYNSVETEVQNIPFSTSNGIYSTILDYEENENIRYRAEIEYTLNDGFTGKDTLYNYNYWASPTYRNDYYFDMDSNTYRIGENKEISVVNKGENFINNGRILYTSFNNRINDVGVTEDTSFKVTFDERDLFGSNVAGAYFNGNVIYKIYQSKLYYDETQRELTLKIQTDKEIYNPGDKVKVTVSSKDENGKTYPTRMIISVVDEAVFAIEDQYVNPITDLYEHKYYYANQYASHKPLEFNSASEGGGEGEGGRTIFKDTAAFIAIDTDSTGRGSAEFTLPDNLTSWRITAVSISDNVYAGVAKKNVTTSIPFFVNQVLNAKYTCYDDFVFTSRIGGTKKEEITENIKYVANIKGEGIDKDITLEANANETATFNFGKLPSGEYEVYISAQVGQYKDAMKKTTYVYESLQEVNINKELDLENININALRFPVKFKFYDVQNELYYDNLEKVLRTSWGNTTEQKVARSLTYNKMSEIEGYNYGNSIPQILQEYDGGVKSLSAGEADVLLTAKICALAPSYIDTQKAISYFNYVINNKESSSEDVSAAYFGLAALKEPVLNEIRYLLKNNDGFDTKDNINLIAGLAFIGDTYGASSFYVEKLLDHINVEKEYKYANFGEESYEITSNLVMILSKINHSDFKSMLRYVIDNTSNKYSPALDLVSYVLEYNPKKDSNGFIEYSIGDNEKRMEFKDKRIQVLTLDKDNFLKFKVGKNKDVKGFAYYVGGIEDAISSKENTIEVTKEIVGANKVGESGTINIKIKFPKDAPKKCYYDLTDVVPSGMRFTEVNKNDGWYLNNRENQKLYFSVYNKNGEATISYNVRGTISGSYLVESAIVMHNSGNINGYSKRGEVKID